VDNSGELIHTSGLGSDIVNSELGLRYTSQVARLDVRLVLTVPVAASWSATHGEEESWGEEKGKEGKIVWVDSRWLGLVGLFLLLLVVVTSGLHTEERVADGERLSTYQIRRIPRVFAGLAR
jgi:hypothetical protein